MSEKLREQLSAVMDGEASQFEARRVLDELRRDARLRADWRRFSQVSAILQGAGANARRGLADRVWRDLRNGSPQAPGASVAKGPATAHPHAWGRLTAVAAALAAVGVLFGVQFTGVGEPEQPGPVVGPAVEGRPAAAANAPPPASWDGMDAYVIQHMRHKAVNHPDVAATTKLVAFELDAAGP